ncbi:hypothetical protein B0T14DRAFT_434119 [Immersiella caudata]|uniref:AAA+ ATPase domain-containing protein n=1 Tax=Immersiella caudata TaxID=314043 RepID=A0AA39WJ38_9PEZI|nr:hypothetical protein B0T14DRAFT_434119 [Immersiella caudata]
MEFIDKYFAKQILLLSRLKSGEEHEVAFQDLWCLFDAGTIVYRPPTESLRGGVDVVSDDSPPAVFRATSQAYRVVSTSGGVPMLSHVMDGRSPRARSGLVDHPETEESHSTNPRKIRAAYTEFYVYCASVDFDGTAYGVIRQIFVFKPFEGRVEVKSLQAYPVSASPDLYPSLLARGRAFIAATNVSHMQYEGLTSGTVREEINSPVVVDMTLAFQSDGDPGKKLIHIPEFSRGMAQWIWSNGLEMFDIFSSSSNSACSHPWCFALRHCHNPYESIQRANRETVESVIRAVLDDFEDPEANKVGSGNLCRLLETQDLLALLPGAVPGFALRSRKWVLLDLDLLKPVQQNNEWGNLVLPPGHREMVQAMVETHTKGLGPRKEIAGMDLVSGKGKGCIILLHGVPGVGKTSTAECVAAHTKKPLYPITCGKSPILSDIGYSPEEVEKNMEGHFRLAHRWGCVLLLDEADVFLAKRDQRDIQRNGLVSVFLRILEYYSGILFLTTNRVGAIDDAFRSRLHLTLYYPKLDREQTLSIFRRNFRRVGEINVDRERNGLVPFEYKAARKRVIPWVKDNWESLAWNGRQIRNTFQTVMALAEFHANNKGDGALPALSRKHFQIVAHASDQFNKYLKATHGFDEDRVAKRDFVRAMEYTPDSSFVYRGRDKDVTDSSSEETESDSADEPSSDQDNDSEETDATKRKKSKKGKKKQKSDDKKSKKGKGKEKKTKEKKKERSEESEDTE